MNERWCGFKNVSVARLTSSLSGAAREVFDSCAMPQTVLYFDHE